MLFRNCLPFFFLVVTLSKATSPPSATITKPLSLSPVAIGDFAPTPAATPVKPSATNAFTSSEPTSTLHLAFPYAEMHGIVASKDNRHPGMDLWPLAFLFVIAVTLSIVYTEWRIEGLKEKLKAEQKRPADLSAALEQNKRTVIEGCGHEPTSLTPAEQLLRPVFESFIQGLNESFESIPQNMRPDSQAREDFIKTLNDSFDALEGWRELTNLAHEIENKGECSIQ